jgi:hypothetical protein
MESHQLKDLLKAMLQSHDDVGVVLRAHSFIQFELSAKCLKIFPNLYDVYDPNKFDISLSTNLMNLMGVPEKFWRPARRINAIRNSFAHNKIRKIENKHSEELLSLMGSEIRPIIRRREKIEKLGIVYEENKLEENPRTKFAIVILLYSSDLMLLSSEFWFNSWQKDCNDWTSFSWPEFPNNL